MRSLTVRWSRRFEPSASLTSCPSSTTGAPCDDGVPGRRPVRSAATPRSGRRWRRRTRGPVSDHTATSPTAPGASTPSSPVAAEAAGAAERRHLQRHPGRAGAGAVAQLGEQHRLAGLQPQRRRSRPTTSRRRRARRARRRPAGRRPGRCPTTRIRLLDGQWATPTPAAPSRRPRRRRASRSGPARPGRCSQPVRSRYSVGRQPNVASENSSSSAFSAKWVCRRTSSRSASSAERTISVLGDR